MGVCEDFNLGGGVCSAFTAEEVLGAGSFASYSSTRQRIEYDPPSLHIKSCVIHSEHVPTPPRISKHRKMETSRGIRAVGELLHSFFSPSSYNLDLS